MLSGQVGILTAIVVYLLAMVYVGFYFSKKGSGDSADDFYLGGRKLGPFVTAMSAEASDMSSWLLMGCLLYTSSYKPQCLSFFHF